MNKNQVSEKRFKEVKDFFNRKSIFRQLKSLALGFVSGRNRDIKLVYNDRGDNYTDGKTVVISLFHFAYNLSFPEIFSVLKACVAHEVAHVLYSNFKYIEAFHNDATKYLEDNHDLPKEKTQQIVKYIHNSLEDGRIERIHATRYKGVLKHFKFLRAIWWENMEVEEDSNPISLWGASILTLATTGMWPKGYDLYGNDEVTELVTSLLPHIHNAIYSNDALTINHEGLEIFKKSGDFLAKHFESLQSNEDFEGLSDFLENSASSAEHQSGEMSDAQMKRIKAELDEVNEEDMSLPHSSDTVSKASDNQSDNSDSDQQSNGGKGKEQQDSSSENSNQSANSSDSGDSDNSKDNDQNKPTGSQSRNSKDEDSDNQEDGQSGDSKDKDSKDLKDNQSSDSKDSSSNKSDDSNKQDSDKSKSQSSSKKDNDTKEDIKDSLKKHEDANKKFIEEVLKELQEDLRRADAEQKRIEKTERQQTVEDDVEIDAGKFCELNGRKYGFEQQYFLASHAPIPAETKRRARMLRQKIEKLLFVEDHSKAQRFKSGRLNASKLWRLGIEENDVFYKKENEAKDYCATLLIDVSGSMNSYTSGGTRYEDALKAASVIEEALRNVIPFNIILFTTSGYDIVHHTIKGFKGSKFNHCQSFLNEHPSAFEANNDAVSIAIAAEKLSKRPEQEKLLFVISDGQPAHYGLSDKEGVAFTKQSIDNARAKGVQVIGIAIGDERHLQANGPVYKEMYGKSLVLTETNKICSTLARLLETTLK